MVDSLFMETLSVTVVLFLCENATNAHALDPAGRTSALQTP